MAKNGAKAKLRAHFLNNIGRIMDSTELSLVSGSKSEWARRVRELRQYEGYKILTHNDRSDLRPGQYLLEDPTPEPAFEETISKEIRAFVLDRNGFTCQMCGAAAREPHPYDATRKTRLQIGHIIDKSKGGTSRDPAFLRALCSVCNEGLQNISPMRPNLKALLVSIRRATNADQLEVLKWLMKKYPSQPAQRKRKSG